MTKKARANTSRIKLMRLLRPWHRRLGLASALFIMLLVITGVAINHSHDFGLAKTPVSQGWILDYYGIPAPAHIAQFPSNTDNSKPLIIANNLLWLDDKLILEAPDTLISAAYLSNMLIAIDTNQAYLFDLAGNLQETQNHSTGLPRRLTAMAIDDHRLWLDTDSGTYQADEQLIDWQAVKPDTPLSWVKPLASVDEKTILQARSANLNWQQLLLDLHSGRLFGAFTVWIWDVFALALLLVSFSGFWIWYKQKPPR